MYPPKPYQEHDYQRAILAMRTYPLGALISHWNGEIMVSHLPIIFQEGENGLGRLIGHMDGNNPQVPALDNQPATVIFSGPEVYISPSYYTTQNQLPTYNYVRVHIKGRIQVVEEKEALRQSLVEMSEILEPKGSPFKLTHDHPRMNRLLPFIKGFTIDIEHWEGKFKLSGDKIPADRAITWQHMIDHQEPATRNFLAQIEDKPE